MRHAIYDFETLGQNFETSPVLSLGYLEFNPDKFTNDEPYEYDELLNLCGYVKFDVADQIQNYGKKIEKDTMAWWESQGEDAKKVLKPAKSDKKITFLLQALDLYFDDFRGIKATWTRGNTFDPMFMRQIMTDIGSEDPFKWWTIRDTRSFLDALLIGTDMNNKFVLPEWEEKFVAHDARHDIVVDVLRMQACVRAIHGPEE